MTFQQRDYAVVTAVRDEARNLPRLARALARQTVPPAAWVIVDNGSSDDTADVGRELQLRHPWIRLVQLEDDSPMARGAPIVRAFHRGLEELGPLPTYVVNVDADVSFDPDFFERLLTAFSLDARLGIASGTCFEREEGEWRQRHVTGTTVWGATRAYRSECLGDVLPLEERLGWDGLDEFKANARGWRTRTLTDLPFRHHRREGERDGSRIRARRAQGEAAWYMGYRPWYLLLRAMHHMRRDPAAIGMVLGYAHAAAHRAPQSQDVDVRRYVRNQQGVQRLRDRVREARGRRPAT
jgi:glycosyltransferase involved in cell wall biosynthesis